MKKIAVIGVVFALVASFAVLISRNNLDKRILGTATGLADSPWPMYHGGPKHGGQSDVDTGHVDGTIKWKFETGGGIESSPVIGEDGTIYVGSHDNKLYAINPDGTKKWEFYAGEPLLDDVYDVIKGILSVPAVAKDGTIYFSSLSDLIFAINPDGTEKWRHELPITSDNWTSPLIGPDGTIYTGGARRKLEGTQESEYYADPIGGFYAFNPDGTLKWHFRAASDMPGSIGLGDDGVLYGYSAEGKQTAIGFFKALSSEGEEIWKYPIGFTESSPTIAEDGTIYIGTGHEFRGFLALTPQGEKKWFFPTPDDISSIPAIGKDGTIYVGDWNGTFYAFNPDGSVKWEFTTEYVPETFTSSAAIGAEGTIYVGANNGKFFAFNPDGSVKWEYDAGSAFVASPAIAADGTVYVGAWDKNLYAFSGSEKESVSVGSVVDKVPKIDWERFPVRTVMTVLAVVVVVGGLVMFYRKRGLGKKWLLLIFVPLVVVAGGYVAKRFSGVRPSVDFSKGKPVGDVCLVNGEFDEIVGVGEDILSIPFDLDDYTNKHWGIIPFCAQLKYAGTVHGAFDFELKPDSKVYSSTDGRVERTEVGTAEGSGEIIAVKGDGFTVGYSGLTNLQIKVGEEIKKGDYIANTVATPYGEHHVHLGISINGNEECPLKYMDDEFLNAFQQMHAAADYSNHTDASCACDCEVVESSY